MKRSVAGVAALMFVIVGAIFTSGPSGAAGQSDLAGLRAATAKFHDLDATLASGRVDLHLCVDQMGQHYANPNTFSDGVLSPTDPEAMVYQEDAQGHLRLVAVEWLSTTPGEVMGMPLHFNPAVNLWVMHA